MVLVTESFDKTIAANKEETIKIIESTTALKRTIKNIFITMTGNARARAYFEAKKILDMLKSDLPVVEKPLDMELPLEVGEKCEFAVFDLSGAANACTIRITYDEVSA